jgi:hypothetical protein
VEVTERLAKKKFSFSQNFGMVNYENSDFGYYSMVLRAANRNIHIRRTQ